MSQDRVSRIASADASHARAILVALCLEDAYVAKCASDLLAKVDAIETKAGQPLEICTQCQNPFYEIDNGPQACRYHGGKSPFPPHSELNVDDTKDFWADHDENCHGIIDTKEMRDEFPEGFAWDCCNELGNATGCTQGRHSAR